MYKKLEEDKKVVLAEEETPEVECNCVCGTTATQGEEPAPEANLTAVHVPDYYVKNG